MRYVGGKTKIAGWVAEHVLSMRCNRHSTYLEPFVGSGAVFSRVAPNFVESVAADAHPDLILMWQAIAEGWLPPEQVSKEEYTALRKAKPSPLRGFVGFGASFGGKWFGGYVNNSDALTRPRWNNGPFVAAARHSILKMADVFSKAKIVQLDYREHRPGPHVLVYCDPPYAGTLGYKGANNFDSSQFWATVRYWSENGVAVVVSETTAPTGWHVLARRERKAALRISTNQENAMRQEALWVYSPQGM